MFEGKRFFPLTGIPIWKIARKRTLFAVWLPEPLTVATWMLKSLRIAFMGYSAAGAGSSVKVRHGDALGLAHELVRGVSRHRALARGGDEQLVLALVGHDVAAGEDPLDRGAHAAVHFDLVTLDIDSPALDGVQIDRRADVDDQVVALEPHRLGAPLGLRHHRPDAAVLDLERAHPGVEVARDLHLVDLVDIALHAGEAVEHLEHRHARPGLVRALGALEPRVAPAHHDHPVAGGPRALGHAVGQ